MKAYLIILSTILLVFLSCDNKNSKNKNESKVSNKNTTNQEWIKDLVHIHEELMTNFEKLVLNNLFYQDQNNEWLLLEDNDKLQKLNKIINSDIERLYQKNKVLKSIRIQILEGDLVPISIPAIGEKSDFEKSQNFENYKVKAFPGYKTITKRYMTDLNEIERELAINYGKTTDEQFINVSSSSKFKHVYQIDLRSFIVK